MVLMMRRSSIMCNYLITRSVPYIHPYVNKNVSNPRTFPKKKQS